jgi:predicted DNA-binding transcriptional regulator YafY
MREGLRSFAVDGIRNALLTNAKAQDISDKECQEHFAESYGIFSGKATQRAKLRFTPEHARWVSSENWHGQQVGSFDKEGYYNLEFDYNQDPELIMDIMKHGSGVEVIAPSGLKNKVKNELDKAARLYSK